MGCVTCPGVWGVIYGDGEGAPSTTQPLPAPPREMGSAALGSPCSCGMWGEVGVLHTGLMPPQAPLGTEAVGSSRSGGHLSPPCSTAGLHPGSAPCWALPARRPPPPSANT